MIIFSMPFFRINCRNVYIKFSGVGKLYPQNRKFHLLSHWDLRSSFNFCSLGKNLPCRIGDFVTSAKVHQQFVNEISFDDVRLKRHLENVLEEFTSVKERYLNGKQHEKNLCKRKFFMLKPVVSQMEELERFKIEVKDLDSLISDLEKENEEDFLVIAREDKKVAETNVEMCKEKILQMLIPDAEVDDRDIVLELSAGVGGQEAMLFVNDLYQMYCNFAVFKRWKWEVLKYDTTGIGGLRQAHLSISGFGAYRALKLESGVHRVQRVPKTERAGRMHTSTATVAVLPQPNEIDIVIEPQDLLMEFKRSGGAGGQHVNRTDSCVRITHVPTGIVAESQVERCQHLNRALALTSLRAKLYQRELESVTENTEHSRKIQVGTAGRSEKVRTYNFAQNRITDHRLQQSVYGTDLFLQGQEMLNEFIENLTNWYKVQTLYEILGKYN